MKYFIYCRKSSEEEGKQLQSLETQERILTDYARLHNLEVIDIIKEKKSAKTEHQRPKFTAIIDRIEKGEGDAILVIDTDRLTRNLLEGAKLLTMFEKGTLKEIRTRNLIYSSLESLNGLIDKIASATKYSRELQIKVLDGNASKLLKGEYPSFAPIGYVNKFPTIVFDPIRAPYIKEIFSLYETGDYSTKQLSKLMYEKGLRSVNGHKVSKSTVNRILRNPEYYGVIRRKGTIYKSQHIGLTDKNTFDTCQDILSGKHTGRSRTHTFLYRGYLNCAVCGCKYTASRKKTKYDYYYCTNSKGTCQEHRSYLSKNEVEGITLKLFKDFSLDEEMADLSFEGYAEDFRKSNVSIGDMRGAIDNKIVTVKKNLNLLLDLLLAQKISQERYDEKNKELEGELVTLEVQLKNLKPTDVESTLELMGRFKREACDLPEIFMGGDDVVKADLLKGVLWNFSLKEGIIQSVQYKKPYSFIQNLSKTADIETWRRGRGSNPR